MTKIIQKIILLCISILCIITVVYAAQESASPRPFENALAKAKKEPSSTDFIELRMLWTKDQSYDPFYFASNRYKKLDKNVQEAWQKKDYEKVIKHCEEILEICYLDIFTHFQCTVSYHYLDQKEEENFHNAFGQGLTRSILSSGDGKSCETAFKAITIAEEHSLLQIRGYELELQALSNSDGRYCDSLKVKDRKTNEEKTIYFDITPSYNFLEKMNEEDKEKLEDLIKAMQTK